MWKDLTGLSVWMTVVSQVVHPPPEGRFHPPNTTTSTTITILTMHGEERKDCFPLQCLHLDHLSTEILRHHNIIVALPRNTLLLHAPEAELQQLSSPYSKSTNVNEALQFHLPQ